MNTLDKFTEEPVQMNNSQLKETIYNLMTGNHDVENYPLEDAHLVADEFAEGSECGRLYDEVYEANRRLCERLGVEEDTDVERIVSNMFKIAEILSYKMYDYGTEVLKKGEEAE